MSCLTVLSRTSVAASMRPLSMDPDRSTMKATSRGFSTSLLTTLDDPKAEKVAWKTPPRAPWAASVVTDLSVHTRPAKRLLRGSSLPRMALKPSAVEGSATHVMVWVEAPAVVAPPATTAATAAASRAATRHRPGRFRGLVCRRSPRRLTSMVSLLLACI